MPLSVPRVGQHEPQAMCVTGVVRPVRSGFQITVYEPNQLRTDAADRADSSPFGERLHRSCDGGVSIPRVLHDVKPQHTMSSMRRKVNGTITLQATVETDGSVSNVVVVKALDPESLDPAAVEALRQWRFVAGRVNGTTIPMIITVDMAFTVR